MRMRCLVRVLVMCGLGLMAGCGGGGGSGGDSIVPTIIPATTKVLDSSSSTKIASVASDQSSITFSETSSQVGNLKSGDVLVLGVTPATPEGLLKKVIGVIKNSDGTTTIQTGDATLEEAVQQASVIFSKSFTDSDIAAKVTVAKGVSKAVSSVSGGVISLNLVNTELYSDDSGKIIANGNISFKPTVDIKIDISKHNLNKFQFSIKGEESSDLTISSNITATLNPDPIELAKFDLGKQVYWIGYVPVVVSYNLVINVGVSGNVTLGLTANASQKLDYTGGIKYENGDWSAINSLVKPVFGFKSPTINASAEVKCYVGPRLDVKFYSAAGPYIEIYGYLRLTANTQKTPLWELFAGFDGNVGAEFKLNKLGVTVETKPIHFELAETSLAQAKAGTYNISGIITYNGQPLEGVQVSTSVGLSTTNSSGFYSIDGHANGGSYAVTPTKAGYTFTSKSVTISNANNTQDFTATYTPPTYTISGKVTLNGEPLSNVIITLGLIDSTVTSTGKTDLGNYLFKNAKSGTTYTITPSLDGYVFDPPSKTVPLNGANFTWDFTATSSGATPTIDMVPIPGGTFTMGDTVGDGYSSELPTHKVTVPSFSIGKYEVTQGQWQAVMGSNPSNFSSCGSTCPVENVSWNDIQTFINTLNTLNTRSGKHYRLPTEAEWEYAARGLTHDQKYSGTSDVNSLGNYAWISTNSGSTTHPVGQKQANGLGLYDMSGNVWEWCQDTWHSNYIGAPTNGTAWDSGVAGSYRVFRGGSWSSDASYARASYRNYNYPNNSGSDVGFRLAL